MKFGSIEMLFLIWAVPALFVIVLYGMKKRQRLLEQFASQKGLSVIAPETGSGRRWIKSGLMLGALLCLAVALSEPLYGYRWQEIEQRGVDIIVALDCSRSMLADDIKPTRLDRAKREIYDLLAMLRGDRIGLVAFSGTAFLQCPLTSDYNAFHIFLNVLTPSYLPVGGTDIAAAVTASLAGFDPKSSSQKAIIIITDGEHTGGSDPLKAAETAQKQDVKIFCVGVGDPQGVPIQDQQGGFQKDASGKIILTKLDEDTLKKMAVMTGGAYVKSVAGDMDLDVIYNNEIRGKMESSAVAGGRKQIWENRYQWFLALAAAALVVEFFIPSVKTAVWIGFLVLLTLNAPAPASGGMSEGIQAYEKEDYEKALKHFIDAQLDDPDNPVILYNIGNTFYKLGDFDAALARYKDALEKADPPLKQKTWYNIGNAEFRKKQFEDAIKSYDESLTLNPDDAQARQNLEFTKQALAKLKEEEQKAKDKEQKSEDEKDQEEGGQCESGQSSEGDSQDQESKQESENGQAESENRQKPEYGKETDESEEQPQGTSGGESEEKPEEEAAAAATEQPSDENKEPDNTKQAERILNRLEDKPGKALMPSYGKPYIEKDW